MDLLSLSLTPPSHQVETTFFAIFVLLSSIFLFYIVLFPEVNIVTFTPLEAKQLTDPLFSIGTTLNAFLVPAFDWHQTDPLAGPLFEIFHPGVALVQLLQEEDRQRRVSLRLGEKH